MFQKLSKIVFCILLLASTANAQTAPALIWQDMSNNKKEAAPSFSEQYEVLETKMATTTLRVDQLEDSVSSLEKKFNSLETGFSSFRPDTNRGDDMTEAKVKLIAEKVFADKFADLRKQVSEAKKSTTSTPVTHKEGDRWITFDKTFEYQNVKGEMRWVQLAINSPVTAVPTVSYETPSVPLQLYQEMPVAPVRNALSNFRQNVSPRYIKLSNGCTFDTVTGNVISCPAKK